MGAEENPAVHAEPSALLDARLAVPKRGVYSEAARRERLAFARARTGRALPCLEQVSLVPEALTGNIENLLGAVEVPVGLAGPLWFRGQKVSGRVYAPMATTEGALVASATRGAIALSRSGGVATRVLRQQMTRVPLFVFSDLHGAACFADLVRSHAAEVREEAHRVSRHAELTAVDPALIGHMVNVRFVYDTEDAAGQNMTTSCTWHACQWLLQQIKRKGLGLEGFLIEGAMSGDKKVTFTSYLSGRGTRVTAECVLEPSVLSHVLRVSADELLKTHERALAGSVQSGMVGYNINVANVVAALFTATGQDIACVHESSLAQLHLERAGNGVYASILLPGLIVGSVGGGTHLPRQNECLQILDCEGTGKSARLAEIIAGYALATDLSTMSAVAGGQFAAAHDRLGRNRRVRWLERQDLNASFFEPGLRRRFADDTLTVREVMPMAASTGESILTDLTARTAGKLIGLFPFRLTYRAGGDSIDRRLEVMVKVKPLDQEVILAARGVAAMAGPALRDAFARFPEQTGLTGCHVRELGVYDQGDPRFRKHMPEVYDMLRDDTREAYVVVMERLTGMTLMDTADDVSGWSRTCVDTALRHLAELHAVWYGREEELEQATWLGAFPTAKSMTAARELWEQLGVHAFAEFPEWVSSEERRRHHQLVETIPEWWSEIEAMPRTLIHNDFNPRNIAFRSRHGARELCAYDWELATLHLPQHDLAELLSFVLTPAATPTEVRHYVEAHRRALEEATGRGVDKALWRRGFALCLADLAVNRIPMYLMAHTVRHFGFMQRVVRTLRRLMALEWRR